MTPDERLKQLVAKMVLGNSYWGYLFSRLARRSTKGLPSIMGVAPEHDGMIALYYQPELVDVASDDVLMLVLEHEGMHVLNKHIPRLIRMLANELNEKRKPMKSQIWNIAADCCVNTQMSMPKEVMVGDTKVYPQFPDDHKLPPDKITEHYFNLLMKRVKEIQCPQCGASGEGLGQSEKGEGGQQEPEQVTCPNCAGGGEMQLDDHTPWTKNLEGVTDLSSLSRKIDTNVGNVIREAVKNFNKRRGTLPSHVQDLIEEALRPPKAPYYEIIRRLVRGSRLSKFRRSPTRINRKRAYLFTLSDDGSPVFSPFPGKKRDYSFYISLIIDTSGSMSVDEILDALSACGSIMEKDRHTRVVVLECDAILQKEYEVKKLRDIQFKVKGRGGTAMAPALKRARELGTDVTLGFTDGYTEDINALPRKMLPKKLIWCVPEARGNIDLLNRTGYIVRI
jgi:predicted metal-dependent peptidase